MVVSMAKFPDGVEQIVKVWKAHPFSGDGMIYPAQSGHKRLRKNEHTLIWLKDSGGNGNHPLSPLPAARTAYLVVEVSSFLFDLFLQGFIHFLCLYSFASICICSLLARGSVLCPILRVILNRAWFPLLFMWYNWREGSSCDLESRLRLISRSCHWPVWGNALKFSQSISPWVKIETIVVLFVRVDMRIKQHMISNLAQWLDYSIQILFAVVVVVFNYPFFQPFTPLRLSEHWCKVVHDLQGKMQL